MILHEGTPYLECVIFFTLFVSIVHFYLDTRQLKVRERWKNIRISMQCYRNWWRTKDLARSITQWPDLILPCSRLSFYFLFIPGFKAPFPAERSGTPLRWLWWLQKETKLSARKTKFRHASISMGRRYHNCFLMVWILPKNLANGRKYPFQVHSSPSP